jgi:HrpA-like RNA helicase
MCVDRMVRLVSYHCLVTQVHEATLDMESVLTTVLDAARHRPSLRVVVMSATIDVAKYEGFLRTPGPVRAIEGAGAPGRGLPAPIAPPGRRAISCGAMDIPGVNFPVASVYPASTWDVNAQGAISNLAKEVLLVFNKEAGNVLVFLMNTQQVRDAVTIMSSLLAHDAKTKVLPLYASLPESERQLVERYVETFCGMDPSSAQSYPAPPPCGQQSLPQLHARLPRQLCRCG